MSEVVLAELVGLGLVSGFVAGVMGVGGGVILVPALVLLFGFGQHVAQGVSLVAIVPAAIAGAAAHRTQGNVIPRLALTLGLASVAGALAGALIAGWLEPAVLKRVFALLLIFVGGRLLWKS